MYKNNLSRNWQWQFGTWLTLTTIAHCTILLLSYKRLCNGHFGISDKFVNGGIELTLQDENSQCGSRIEKWS